MKPMTAFCFPSAVSFHLPPILLTVCPQGGGQAKTSSTVPAASRKDSQSHQLGHAILYSYQKSSSSNNENNRRGSQTPPRSQRGSVWMMMMSTILLIGLSWKQMQTPLLERLQLATNAVDGVVPISEQAMSQALATPREHVPRSLLK
ncbi:uncharacterized protein [Elaeis guineensis]|uniref:Uncharacterized protein LOC105044235 n=1 Tax=Elaeis guineensis var. tenera TaxID=51953 RepID=A0A6J0PH62_ELAGV|nr:uncharacterized protein LOC105044235 [Elaeis guineensis]